MSRKIRRIIGRNINIAVSRLLESLAYLPGMDRIKTSTYTVESPRIPSAFDGFSLVFVSDLHAHDFNRGHEERQILGKAAEALQPDLIVTGGDWIRNRYRGKDRDIITSLEKELAQVAPTVGILGNHETKLRHKQDVIDDLTQNGIVTLLDQSLFLVRDGECIKVTGVETLYHLGARKDKKLREKKLKAYFSKCRKAADDESYCLYLDGNRSFEKPDRPYMVLLAHRPELIHLYEKLGADLTLSGHAHGGLMKMPFGQRLIAPGQGWFPKYTHGCHQAGDMTEIISEGLGGPRVFIRPELVKVVLKHKPCFLHEESN
jgi:predicted MPP superfamily phosphohydrolase